VIGKRERRKRKVITTESIIYLRIRTSIYILISCLLSVYSKEWDVPSFTETSAKYFKITSMLYEKILSLFSLEIHLNTTYLNNYIYSIKVKKGKAILVRGREAYKVVRRQGSHIF
jgi:hypothetical protein